MYIVKQLSTALSLFPAEFVLRIRDHIISKARSSWVRYIVERINVIVKSRAALWLRRRVDARGEHEKHSYILGTFCVYGLLTACDCLELHQ